MAEFILIILVLAVCGLIFGKADTKRDILNQVGLDLSYSNYESKKEREFEKYTKKAMKNAIDVENYSAKDESKFLSFLIDRLDLYVYGRYEDNGMGIDEYKSLYLGVSTHYVKHALRVACRRQEDMKKGNTKPLVICDFNNKRAAKKYIEVWWNKYQYPWPEDWKQRDGM